MDQAPAITSAASATFTVGQAGSFTVTTKGFPAAALSESGALPSGVTFIDNGNGTATLSGTPAAGTGSLVPYSLTITASNGVAPGRHAELHADRGSGPGHHQRQQRHVHRGQGRQLHRHDHAGAADDDRRSARAAPCPAASPSPPTATARRPCSGTPAAGTGGSYTFTITASNAAASQATQTFTLTVDQAPAITSANSATFAVGQAGSFTVTTTGFPARRPSARAAPCPAA